MAVLVGRGFSRSSRANFAASPLEVSTVAGVEGSEFTSARTEKTRNGLCPQTAMLVYCKKKVSTVAVSLVLIHVSLY